MREYGIGQPVPRVEDRKLLQGLGSYTDDRLVAGAAHMYVVRSPHAAAKLLNIDTTKSMSMPGVLQVLTANDATADNLGKFTCSVKRKQRNGSSMLEPDFPILVSESINMVGAPIAIVVAETLNNAMDAAENIEIEYEILPSITNTGAALNSGAAQVWSNVENNESFYFKIGDESEVDKAFSEASHITSLELVISRVSANTIEPRGAIGFYDRGTERYTLYAGMQSPHRVRTELAINVLKIPESHLRVISPDMGGGFGMRGLPFAEHALVLWASKRVGRPVRWIATRTESLASDAHARDNVTKAGLAIDKEGKFLGIKVSTKANLGGYLNYFGPHSPTNNLGGLSGVYTTPHIFAEVSGLYTHTSPTAPYRGAGRPEASYVLERLIEVAANELGYDPVDLRIRNMISKDSLPYNTGFVFTYDTGEFETVLDKAIEAADYENIAKRKSDSQLKGKLLGIGFASVIEIAGGPHPKPMEESATIRFESDGGLTLALGTHSHGQGHETVFRQIISEILGLEFSQINLIYGDTDIIPHGKGTFGSRSIVVGGTAIKSAADKIIKKASKIAAHLLETSEEDISFFGGSFIVDGTDRSLHLIDIAKASFKIDMLPQNIEIGLNETAITIPQGLVDSSPSVT